ncbi:MAG TPA: sigma-70 family RNA polymerase sigma factor [Gemmataceae bacterium]|jgi:RNA polymerase sigma factor (sigma-70 family)
MGITTYDPAIPAQTETAPTDVAEVFALCRRILYGLAYRCLRQLRSGGRGHGLPDAEDLIAEGFLAVLAVREHFAARNEARFTNFAYVIARRAIFAFGRASQLGLSTPEYRRQAAHFRVCGGASKPTRRCSPEYLARIAAPSQEDDDTAGTARPCVAALLDTLPETEQDLLRLFMEEQGNYSSIGRRLGKHNSTIGRRYHQLFARIRERVLQCVA